MKKRRKKRIISLTMVLALCLTLFPTSALAAEDSGAAIVTGGLCVHHTEHDEACGYVEGTEESPCTHQHSEECYHEVTSCTHEHTPDCYSAEDSSIPEDGTTSSEDTETPEATPSEPAEPTACSHVCSEESGCIKQELDCQHEHNEECGYAPAVEGQPCTYVCTLCGMTEITAWSWVDTQDVLDPESGVLALSASAESPVPYEDIVDLLPVEIEATTENGTETLSLDSWSCDDYPAEGAYTGSYAFHAVLPEGYGLAADAPALTVTVEFGGVAMLADDGDHRHPICGASCTDGKHGIRDFNSWLGNQLGTDAKTWVLSVGGGNHSVDGDMLSTNGSEWVLPEGTYYLKDDIYIDKPIKIYGNVTICLNGHDISVDKDVYAFKIDRENRGSKGGNLTLTDCKENRGEIKSYDTANLAYGGVSMISDKNCTFNMYGGTIKGAKSGVYVHSNCIFNMYGGVISDTASSGVVVTDSSATFNMYGGEISRNTNYGVDVEKYAAFNMYGGVIKDITKQHGNTNFSGVYCKGSHFNMHGGVISGCNRGVHVTVNSDNPNRPAVPGEFTMDGGTIKENKIGVSLYAIFNKKKWEILTSPKYTMTGGEIINNTEIGVDMGAYTDSGTGSSYSSGGKLFVGGTAKIQNNGNNYGNVYFHYGEIKLASTPFTEGAYIGITASNSILPTEGKPLLIATGASPSEVADYFHSDRDGYVIKCANTDDSHTTHTLNLTVSPHTHSWNFTKENGNDSKIFVTCTGTTGTCAYKTTQATVTISTTQKEYDCATITEAPKAVLTYSDNWPKDVAQVQESTIEYYKSIDGGSTYTDLVHNNKDLMNPGKYLAQVYVKGSKYLVTYFSVVDNSKQDPNYTAPTAIPGLTYNGREHILINAGHTEGGQMQYRLAGGTYSTTLPTAIDAGSYTVYYKVVGDATHNDTAEQSITVTIGKAPLTGTPTFTPVTEAGKTIADVTLTAPTGWPAGTFSWMKGETGLEPTTPITQGTPYPWVFIPGDKNYKSIGGGLVLWKDTSGGSSSNPGGGSSGGGSSSNSGGGSSGGGSSSNTSSSSTPLPSTPVTVPVSGDEKTIQVNATVRDTTATIQNVDLSKLNTVIGDTVKTGVVTIDFSALKKVDTVKLPSNVVNQFAAAVNDPNNHAKGLEIVLTNGISVELGAGVLGEKALQAKVSDITISSRPLTDSSLNSSLSNSLNGSLNSLQMLAVGNRPAFDINITIGGKPISDIGGEVTVSASYELNPGEQSDGIVVYYVDDNGSKQLCETSYDPIRKRVSWKTSPLSPSSVYMIGYDEKLVKPDTDAYVTYTVQKGNTLSAIAKKHGCTVADIIAANSDLIKNPNRIHVGWQLKIPQK